ncbi:unnamed protein product [Urochloa decumbens]|uniref:DUF295 domain-containing protein n=1 Tax=Urochloa decumbens TaxID=240449 RepID=A0ABC9GKS6_9POAL
MATTSSGGGIHALCEDALASPPCPCSAAVPSAGAGTASLRPAPSSPPTPRAASARRRRRGTLLPAASSPYLYDPCPRAEDGTTKTGAFDLRASLDGLLVLEELLRGRGTFIVCKPITRQWTSLPALTHQCSAAYACGFYFHASSGEYRLLCHGVEGADGNYSHYYYILSAGSARPRRLARAPSCQPKPSNSNEVLYDIPVSYRGNLHWFSEHPLGGQTGKMLAFDTASETTRPTGGGPALRHRVTLPRPRDVRVVGVPPARCRALPVGRSGILIACPTATMGTVYDLKEKKGCGVVDLGGFPKFAVFSESLVPHAFFDLPRRPDIVPPKFSDPFDEHM